MRPLKRNIEFCNDMLPQVSRTFAPTIRMLPKRLFLPVNVAYLLCRIADTVEDESLLSKEKKEELLALFASIIKEGNKESIDKFLDAISDIPEHSPDVKLMKNLDRVLQIYNSFSIDVQKKIATWVIEMTMGMKKYAQSPERKNFQFLHSMKELDEYTYYVAGTVGNLLTSLFEHFSKKITPPVRKRLDKFSESFGKGLQLVNIIRDMTTDLRRGQSYIPEEILRKYQLTRSTIFEAENREQAERLFNEMIQIAVWHLDNAIAYVVNIPKEEARIRIFCLLPLFWAMQTLKVIQANTLALLQMDKIKISRGTIRIEFLKSLILTFSNRLTIRHYKKIRKNINQQPLHAI